MAWKTVSTYKSVDLELGDFSNEQLLQGLIYRKWLSETEAEAIKKRGETKKDAKVFATQVFDRSADSEEFEAAQDYIKRGLKEEAILHLERWLGRDWIGRLA